jgi:hypothetical protein
MKDKISIDELVNSMEELSFIEDLSLPYAGQYWPEECQARFNPERIMDMNDFYATIVHESIHHADYDDLLTEEQVCGLEQYYLNDSRIMNYLDTRFYLLGKKFWSE